MVGGPSYIPRKYSLSLNMTVISSPPALHDTGENIYHFYWLGINKGAWELGTLITVFLWTGGEGVHQLDGISVPGRGQAQVKLLSLDPPITEDGTNWTPAQVWELRRLKMSLCHWNCYHLPNFHLASSGYHQQGVKQTFISANILEPGLAYWLTWLKRNSFSSDFIG